MHQIISTIAERDSLTKFINCSLGRGLFNSKHQAYTSIEQNEVGADCNQDAESDLEYANVIEEESNDRLQNMLKLRRRSISSSSSINLGRFEQKKRKIGNLKLRMDGGDSMKSLSSESTFKNTYFADERTGTLSKLWKLRSGHKKRTNRDAAANSHECKPLSRLWKFKNTLIQKPVSQDCSQMMINELLKSEDISNACESDLIPVITVASKFILQKNKSGYPSLDNKLEFPDKFNFGPSGLFDRR